MANFRNEAERLAFQKEYCCDCIQDGECEIMIIYARYSGDKRYQNILDLFIPANDDGTPEAGCTMYVGEAEMDGGD